MISIYVPNFEAIEVYLCLLPNFGAREVYLCKFERGTGAREIYSSVDQMNKMKTKD